MSSHTRFEDKIDVLDIIISILKDHEENLSNIVDKLDSFVRNLSILEKKMSKLDQPLQQKKFRPESERRIVFVECKKWSEFRDACAGASLVAFDMSDSVLSVNSSSREFVFRYSERLPDASDVLPSHSGNSAFRGALHLNTLSVRHWLSEELKVPEDKIVEGALSTT